MFHPFTPSSLRSEVQLQLHDTHIPPTNPGAPYRARVELDVRCRIATVLIGSTFPTSVIVALTVVGKTADKRVRSALSIDNE